MIDTIVDLHHPGHPDFQAMRAGGICAVIHKATEGGDCQDPEYQARRIAAKAAGLLWGSFHYSSGAPVAKQVSNYLTYADPQLDEVACIDFEASTSGPDMSLQQLEQFVLAVRARIGRAPLLYGGELLRRTLANAISSVLPACPLWYSRYAPAPKGIPSIWSTWTLWQYTDGAAGPEPHTIPGFGRGDRSQFDGTEGQLRDAWPFKDVKPSLSDSALQPAAVSALIAEPRRNSPKHRAPKKASRPKRVRTPGGPRPAERVHLVKPGQVVRRMPDKSHVIRRARPKGGRK